MVWAFAKLGTLHPAVREVVAPVQAAAVAPIAAVVGKLRFRFLAMAAWALAASGQRHQELFDKIASRLALSLHGAEMLVDVAWAFSSAGVRNERLLSEVAAHACRHMSCFDPPEFARLCQMLSSEGIVCPVFSGAGAQRCESATMPRLQLVTMPPCPNSFASSCTTDGVDTTKVEAQRCTGSTVVCDEDSLSDAFSTGSADDDGKVGKLHSVSWAVADLDDAGDNVWTTPSSKDIQSMQADPSYEPPVSSMVNCNVKNTFLEFDEEDLTEEVVSIRQRLPPALDFVLASIPRDELDALRSRYQQWRDL